MFPRASFAPLVAVSALLVGTVACKGKSPAPAAKPDSALTAHVDGDAPSVAVRADVGVDTDLRGLPDGFDDAALRAAVTDAEPSFQRCYVGRVGARPGLSGTDVFDVTATADGLAAQVASTETRDAPLVRCLLARLNELPAAKDSALPPRFQLAISFSPGDRFEP